MWDGGELYLRESLASGDILRLTKGKRTGVLRPPSQYRFADVVEGNGYFWTKEPPPEGSKQNIIRFLRTSDFVKYQSLGTFSVSPAVLDYKLLDDGKMLILVGLVPLGVGGEASFLVKARPTEHGAWEIEQEVDLGLDLFDSKLKQQHPKHPQLWARKDKGLFLHDLVEAKLHRLGSHLVLPLQATGVVLVFKAENGQRLGICRLFPSTEEAEQRGKPLERAILFYRATPDGDLILASRSEDAVLNSRRVHQDGVSFSGLDTEGYFQRLKEVQSKALITFPDVFWWRFIPETRQFVRLPTPKGFPSAIRTFDDLQKLKFWVDPKGNLVPTLNSPPFQEAPRPILR